VDPEDLDELSVRIGSGPSLIKLGQPALTKEISKLNLKFPLLDTITWICGIKTKLC